MDKDLQIKVCGKIMDLYCLFTRYWNESKGDDIFRVNSHYDAYQIMKHLDGEYAVCVFAGEHATKFLTIHVTGAKTFESAKQVGMSVAKSPLVKTAFFGEDPNWGRVICAVGYSGVPMEPEKTVVKFGGIAVYDKGVGAKFDEAALRKVMAEHDVVIDVELGLGNAEATVWSCDFSYEYVKINGEYHT